MKFFVEIADMQKFREGIKSRGYSPSSSDEGLLAWCITRWIPYGGEVLVTKVEE